MYVPKHFKETRTEVLHRLISERPLGTLVAATRNGLEATHIPFLLDSSSGRGSLLGHVARKNPLWREFLPSSEVLVIFQGPDRYITPSWYATKQETGKVVPTWNYVSMHAYGCMRAIDDRQWLHAHLEQLTNRHEAAQAQPWHVSDAPRGYIDDMLGAVIGLEIRLSRVVGKWKVSQNRPACDRQRVIEGLTSMGDDEALVMARLIDSLGPA